MRFRLYVYDSQDKLTSESTVHRKLREATSRFHRIWHTSTNKTFLLVDEESEKVILRRKKA